MAGLPGPKPKPQQQSVLQQAVHNNNGLPSALYQNGFRTAEQLRSTIKTMIACDGLSDTGKSEFGASAPGPVAFICNDRGHEGMLMNQNPPSTRRKDVGYKVKHFPSAALGDTREAQEQYIAAWIDYRNEVYSTIVMPDIKTVVLDGDSDSYEIQRLAEFGKLSGIPPLMYASVKMKRRGFVNRLNDAGKIIISTSKVKYEYEDKIHKLTGQIVVDKDGEPIRVKSDKLVTQGLNEEDRDYLWQIVIRHMHRTKTYNTILKRDMPSQYGIKILKCKPNMELIGTELWGSDCWFGGLVQVVYPHIPLESWYG